MLNINSKYENDIQQYCKLNNIVDVNLFVTQCFKQGFDIKKYGFLGNSLNEGEKHLINEVIVEKRIEIPVEVIKEIPVEVKVIEYVDREVIKEVIVEVPKEKIVTKIEYISDKENENELLLNIQQLNLEMSKKDNELDELRRNLDVILDKPPIEIIKEVDVTDNSKQKMLELTLQNLRKELTMKNSMIVELETKNKQLESNNEHRPAMYLKGSNLTEKM
jgi:hypothetical protein